jgi:hypothetical protein
MFPKKLVMGKSLWPLPKKTKNKKCEHTHELINMNNTTDYTLKINYLTFVGFLGTEDFFNLLGGNNWFRMS